METVKNRYSILVEAEKYEEPQSLGKTSWSTNWLHLMTLIGAELWKKEMTWHVMYDTAENP